MSERFWGMDMNEKGVRRYRIDVRNLDEFTINRITEMAEKAGMTREAYVRMHLKNLAVTGEMKALEDKYSTLVKTLLDYIETQGEIIEQNVLLMSEIKEKLDV